MENRTHNVLIGYSLWIFGFTGSHRFYLGRPVSGTIYFFTFGIFGIGWFLDLFFMPTLARQASVEFQEGPLNYDIAWILLTYLGIFGVHRMYMRKWGTGILYLLTFGLLGAGYIYDYWTLNRQIAEINRGVKKEIPQPETKKDNEIKPILPS